MWNGWVPGNRCKASPRIPQSDRGIACRPTLAFVTLRRHLYRSKAIMAVFMAVALPDAGKGSPEIKSSAYS